MRSVRRGLAALAAALALVAPVTAMVAPTAGALAVDGPATAVRESTAVSAPLATQCPVQNSCVTDTIPGFTYDGVVDGGGTIEIGPTTNLGADQSVYIYASGFAPDTTLRVNYCSDASPLPTVPLCLAAVTASIINAQVTMITGQDGSANLSYQVLENDTSNPPLAGQELGVIPKVNGSFFCDAATPCSVDVTDVGVGGTAPLVPTVDNTAVVPVSFVSLTNACSGSATIVDTESEYGIELALPEASQLSCNASQQTGSTDYVDFNTAVDGQTAVQDLSSTGGPVISFTDDPEQSDQQSVLKQGNYALIPVALTANVVAFRALVERNGSAYLSSTMSLTPNMVAGLIIGAYTNPSNAQKANGTNAFGDADLVACPTSGCPSPPCVVPTHHKKTVYCSLLAQLNYQPGFTFSQLYQSFMRSDTAGSNGLLMSWLCNAPNASVPVSDPETSSTFTATYDETETAAQVLEQTLGNGGTPLSSCPDVDQLPPIALGQEGGYNAYNDPSIQATKGLDGYAPPPTAATDTYAAAFGSMNWAEAEYYGMSVASLQNADGQFVLPTTQSLQAAVADATTNPDGAISPDYATKDPAAYPMTSVIYAAVCADPVPTAQAAQETGVIDSLLALTGPTTNGVLPGGFVPLTQGLYQQAETDINNDIVGGGSGSAGCPLAPSSSSPSPSPGTSAPTTTPSTSSTPTTSGSSGSSGVLTSVPSIMSSSGGTVTVHESTPHAPTPQNLHFGGSSLSSGRGRTSKRPALSAQAAALRLAADPSRVMVILVLLLGLLAALAGGLLLAFPGLRLQVLTASRLAGQRLGKTVSSTSQSMVRLRRWLAGGDSRSPGGGRR